MDHTLHIQKPLPSTGSRNLESSSGALTAEHPDDFVMGLQQDPTEGSFRDGLRQGTTILGRQSDTQSGKIVAFDLVAGLYQVEDPPAEYPHWTLMNAIAKARTR